MYLPYAASDKGLHCYFNGTNDNPKSSFYSKNDYKGASFVLKWTERPAASEVLNARFAVVRSQAETVWTTVL